MKTESEVTIGGAAGDASASRFLPCRAGGLRACAKLVLLLLVAQGCQVSPRSGEARAPIASVARVDGAAVSVTGCEVGYSILRPAGEAGPVDVVLAHGFLRSRARMSGLATALAERGIATLTLDLCNMRPWDGAHEANADDMRRMARALGRADVVYAGFSAGGLAAVLAGSRDPDAAGVVVLDLVDRDGLGARAAARLGAPIHGLFGDPAACNAYGNGREVLARAPAAYSALAAGASHCDFEAPTDILCRLVCEPADRPSQDPERQREQIIAWSVDAVAELLGRVAAPDAPVQTPSRP
jgi:pimeloyl-ACP methyl ester carboxylesterase